MKALAQRGHSVLVQLDEDGTQTPFPQVRGAVVDMRRQTVSEPRFVESILARGYWTPFEGDEEEVLGLVAAGFNPSQPRDREGKWTETGATTGDDTFDRPDWLGEPGVDADDLYYKSIRPREAVQIARAWLEDQGVTEHNGIPLELLNEVGVVAAMNEHYPDGYEMFLSIQDMHKEDFRRNYMQGGEYEPSRQDLHRGIRASYLAEGRVPTDGPPEALFLAGGSGAGKSTIVEAGNLRPEGSVYINPDDIKELFPESRGLNAQDDWRWAMLSHEESSDIAADLRADAVAAGYPMVIDGTGDAAPGKFLGKIRDAEAQGYATKVVFVDVDTDEAIRRATIRAQETGRKVGDQAIRDIHQNVTARHLEWRDEVDNWEVWANDDPPAGRRVIARRVAGGPIEVLDRVRYAEMERKAGG